MRLDICVAQKYNISRNKAQQSIDAGRLILIDNSIIYKANFMISGDEKISLQNDRRTRWVSRSAEKLVGFLEKEEQKALAFKIQNAICLDVGASTGGFSQILLEYNAKNIDCVEVGTNQLHEILKNNPKIHSYEQCDIRNFRSKNSPYDIIVCDASFVSLYEILDAILLFSDKKTDIILLFKPQFEVSKNMLTKTGVPKNETIILDAMQHFEEMLNNKGCIIIKKEKSSLQGEAGNWEWIYWVRKK